jgi:hypothetical protein
VLELSDPAELSAVLVDDASPLDEIPLVVSDTLVTPGPVENAGGVLLPHAARAKR